VQRVREVASSSLAERGAAFSAVKFALQPVLFALVGASSAVIDVSIFWLLTSRGHLAPLVANAVSYGIGGGNSFLLNSLLTFRHRRTGHSARMQVGLFVFVRCLCLLVSSVALAVALRLAPSLVAKLIANAITLGVAYALSSRLVFREAGRLVASTAEPAVRRPSE
jgi:putative flippase GtrA